MHPPTVVVLGTGAFAQALTKALVSEPDLAFHLSILGRSPAAVQRMLDLAHPHQRSVSTSGTVTNLSSDADLTPHLQALQPTLVLVCASLHSPYSHRSSDAWSAVLDHAGFGVTGLLQAPIAVRAAQATAQVTDAQLVNACYPDFVNPLLAALGIPVLCGLGNVHTLASGLRAALPWDHGPVRVLAHHRHLKPDLPAAEDARIWSAEASGEQATAALGVLRARPRLDLNSLGAAAGGRLLAALLRGERVAASLPGPYGLPGGYPVRVDGRRCDLDLPTGVSVAEAVAWNRCHAAAEGIDVTPDGMIEFAGPTADALDRLDVVRTSSISVDAWDEASRRLVRARTVLAAQRAASAALQQVGTSA